MRKVLRSQAGYSLVELMIVTGILAVVTGMAVIQIGSTREGLNGDGAMRVVVSQMNQAKQLAITQRRLVQAAPRRARMVMLWPSVTTVMLSSASDAYRISSA